MSSIRECERKLRQKGLSEDRIKEIKDFLYALSKEIISNEMSRYEPSLIGDIIDGEEDEENF